MSDIDKTQPYSHEIDLEVITGSPVVRVVGYVSGEFGEPTFKITRVITQAGESYYAEGEHDMPYLTDLNEVKLAEHYDNSEDDEEAS